jgi:hypothetical protein
MRCSNRLQYTFDASEPIKAHRRTPKLVSYRPLPNPADNENQQCNVEFVNSGLLPIGR